MKVEQRTDPVAYHGEGPAWYPGWGGLRFVDMLAGDVLSLHDDGTIGRRHVSDVVAVLRPRRGGGAVLGIERGFALEAADGTVSRLPSLWDDPGVRMNEGACDPDGRFYCGSMAMDRTPGAGRLHRLDPDGRVTVVLEDVTISNGLAWGPDGTVAYYIDTETYRITAFRYDRRAGLTDPRVFATVDPADGRPDGLAVDVDGGVWVALNGGGAVRRFSAAGVREGEIQLPVTKVTACAFGGPAMDELFITTSREHLAADEQPAAGALFHASVGIEGLPLHEFGG